MIRVVLAAVLAVAVLGASLPAVEDARADRTATRVDTSVERLSAAGSALAYGSDATSDAAVAPTRTVTFSLPSPTWTSAGIDYVAVGGQPGGQGNRSVVTYAVAGGTEITRRLSLPVALRTPNGPIVLRGYGDRPISVALRRTADGPVLVASRAYSG
ncbi:hypothetical protein C499_16117 [Halogeometricum borinquense DSM 11551]|uniref:DUF7311 domain-containing protein n=2 Tax=Halogeometricum borinquense TaxID=60847 RepID=E4NRX8_HALBP|nr:hypothetical protein [Halogeometricum borinquense]ADQ68024.1 hypothetical protein Hbor_24660 [Halogeometricum borinquense DSM 11551]ELY24055.1 hypothetical protein C499_16117 [Halogeometricum borinquense DSM 11551]RYJ13059.1 hypothetical protein ELS19_03125 [Halogeometricum borinquense]